MNATAPPDATDTSLHGEIGVLAYDEVTDRIQCHVCGAWLQKIEARHLGLHGLSIPEYKERYGLNEGTPLETPRITEVRRRKNREHEGWRNLRRDHDFVAGQPRSPRATRPQFYREQYTSERQRERSRQFSDEEMLSHLRGLQERHGGEVRREDLNHDRPGQRGVTPSRNTIIERFGSWRRVCELLGQPYRIGRRRSTGSWSNKRYAYRTLPAAYQAALRSPEQPEGGHTVTLAAGVEPAVVRRPVLWTDGESYRVYEDVKDGAGMETAQAVPSVWRERARERGT